MLTFLDPAGNPLPAAVKAVFYAGNPVPLDAVSVLNKYVQIGGTLDPGTSLTDGTVYTVAFVGTWAPQDTLYFTYTSGQSQTITVANYQSPVLSQANFAARQAKKWVRGAFGDTARTTGGVAYNLAYGLSYGLYTLSTQIQQVIQAMRLPTAVDTSIDSWVQDFFGNRLPRASGESNDTYRNRATANLSAKKGLRAGILTIASFFGTSWINEPWRSTETGGWDADGVFAWDTIGGWGDQKPLIQMFVEPNAGVNSSQMKSNLLAARAAGIDTQVISVTPGANGEGWGVGKFGVSHFGVQSQAIGTIL